MKKSILFALFLTIILIACDKTPDVIPIVPNAPDEEFNKLFTFSDGLVGSSSTHSVALPDGRTLWLFSDSFIGKANADRSTTIDKINSVKNVGMIQSGTSFQVINITENGKIKNLVDATASGNSLSVAHGTLSGGVIEILVHEYNITQRYLRPQIATFSFPALKFTGLTELKPLNTISYGDYILSDENYHYLFGRETRGSAIRIHVARAALGKLANQPLWQYFNGITFVDDAAATQPILGTSAKQFSVVKDGDKFKIILQKDNNVVAYTAPLLVGPYDAGKTLFSIAAKNTSNAFVHSQFLTKEGQHLISYDIQNLGSQNQDYLKNIDLFRPKFYRHDLK